MIDSNDRFEARLADIEKELGILRSALRVLMQQDVEVLTLAKSSEGTELQEAFDEIRSNLKDVAAIINLNRPIGSHPEPEERENG